MAKTQTSFGIGLPQVSPAALDPRSIKTFLSEVEDLGYESLWVQEKIIGGPASLDPLTLLTFASALTTNARLGLAILTLPIRDPVQLAKAVSTLDNLSNGRVIVGVGLGDTRTVDFSAYGIPFKKRVSRFNEAVNVMRLLWRDEHINYDGNFCRLKDVTIEPRPFQKPCPPIWFGASHPAALRRTAKMADGWIGAGASTLKDFRESVIALTDYLKLLGREPSSFPVAKRVYITLTSDKMAALTRLETWFGLFYGDASIANDVCIIGDESECVERLREIISAGATTIILNPVYDELNQARLLATKVMVKV